jgi:hypothetical protein
MTTSETTGPSAPLGMTKPKSESGRQSEEEATCDSRGTLAFIGILRLLGRHGDLVAQDDNVEVRARNWKLET